MDLPEQEYSLREKKFAKTKISLAQAFMEKMKETRFPDISIKEVCESVEVSEGTFYNYFPQKVDIVYYFKNLTNLKIAWEVEQKKNELGSLRLIEYVFELVSKEMSVPYFFYEMVSVFAAERRKLTTIDLSKAEKEFAYPECNGIKDIEINNLEELLLFLIKTAQQEKEIISSMSAEKVLVSLMSILIGVPMVISIEDFKELKDYFSIQLSLLWKAIGAKRNEE